MVLQVLAHTGQVVAYGNAVALQQLARADARQLQDLRRVDRARAQQYLVACLHADHFRAGQTWTPLQRWPPPASGSNSKRLTWAWVHSSKLGRP